MAFCEMILIFRDPVPEALIPDLLADGVLGAAVPIFERASDRAYQIAANCSPSQLRHDLKQRLSGTAVYALASIKHETLVVNLSADG